MYYKLIKQIYIIRIKLVSMWYCYMHTNFTSALVYICYNVETGKMSTVAMSKPVLDVG